MPILSGDPDLLRRAADHLDRLGLPPRMYAALEDRLLQVHIDGPSAFHADKLAHEILSMSGYDRPDREQAITTGVEAYEQGRQWSEHHSGPQMQRDAIANVLDALTASRATEHRHTPTPTAEQQQQ